LAYADNLIVIFFDWDWLRGPISRKAPGRDHRASNRCCATRRLDLRAQRAKAAWARLIRKVYESNPLVCPKCDGPMRVIALSVGG